MVIGDETDLCGRLTGALDCAWDRALEVASALRDAAYDQIQRSRRTYGRLKELAGS
jgi:hypothetical protein